MVMRWFCFAFVATFLVACGNTPNTQATQTRTSEVIELTVVTRLLSTQAAPVAPPTPVPIPPTQTPAPLPTSMPSLPAQTSSVSPTPTQNVATSSDGDIWQRVWTYDKAMEFFMDRHTNFPSNTGRGVNIPNPRALPASGLLTKLDGVNKAADALTELGIPSRMRSLQTKILPLVAATHAYTDAARQCVHEGADCQIPADIVQDASRKYAAFMDDYETYHLPPPAIPNASITQRT